LRNEWEGRGDGRRGTARVVLRGGRSSVDGRPADGALGWWAAVGQRSGTALLWGRDAHCVCSSGVEAGRHEQASEDAGLFLGVHQGGLVLAVVDVLCAAGPSICWWVLASRPGLKAMVSGSPSISAST
ncbi:hypothetical protein, partial [Streptomyces sp. NPDC093990]|uniref:hypothetical protein n=1 Tax=Streptomyces sp. NPDC093990 TaxID=3155306 RepID=UPI00342EEA3A